MVQVSVLVDTDQGQYLLVVVILLIFFYKCIAISLFFIKLKGNKQLCINGGCGPHKFTWKP